MRHGIKLIFEHMTQKDVRSIVPLSAGITNDNYLINNAFVLRYVSIYVFLFIFFFFLKLVFYNFGHVSIREKV